MDNEYLTELSTSEKNESLDNWMNVIMSLLQKELGAK